MSDPHEPTMMRSGVIARRLLGSDPDLLPKLIRRAIEANHGLIQSVVKLGKVGGVVEACAAQLGIGSLGCLLAPAPGPLDGLVGQPVLGGRLLGGRDADGGGRALHFVHPIDGRRHELGFALLPELHDAVDDVLVLGIDPADNVTGDSEVHKGAP